MMYGGFWQHVGSPTALFYHKNMVQFKRWFRASPMTSETSSHGDWTKMLLQGFEDGFQWFNPWHIWGSMLFVTTHVRDTLWGISLDRVVYTEMGYHENTWTYYSWAVSRQAIQDSKLVTIIVRYFYWEAGYNHHEIIYYFYIRYKQLLANDH